MSFTRLLPVAAAITIACTAALAHAQEQPANPTGDDRPLVIVFPIESSLPAETFADISPQLTYVVVRESENRGLRVSVAKTSFADTVMLVGCAEESNDCYRRMLEQLGANEAIYGTVAPAQAPGKVDIELRHLRKGESPTSARYTVQAETSDALVTELDHIVPPFLEGSVDSSSGTAGNLFGGSFSAARVHKNSWIVLGSGAAATVTGMLFWSLASVKQGAIDDAPTATREELERLEDLENSAGRRATIGNVLFTGGLIATAIGAVMVIRQGRADASEETSVTFAPMPAPGGMGLAVTLEWP